MIYTSYFANIKNLPDNCTPVAICGRSPETYKGVEYKKLAPKRDFFDKWKETHDNDMYIREYKSRVTDKLDQYKVIDEIINFLPGNAQQIIRSSNIPIWLRTDFHIVLICYEKPNEFCHRHLVAAWLRSARIMCRELIAA